MPGRAAADGGEGVVEDDAAARQRVQLRRLADLVAVRAQLEAGVVGCRVQPLLLIYQPIANCCFAGNTGLFLIPTYIRLAKPFSLRDLRLFVTVSNCDKGWM